jgi:geranylgeranyl pyrophosphate synthase
MKAKMQSLRYRKLLEVELSDVEKRLQQKNDRVPAPTLASLHALITNGGKRLRPALVLLSAHIFDTHGERATSLAAAIELLHTATLIHDDLIDKASRRRNTPTLNRIWDPATAVLTGDLVFAWAARLAAESDDIQIIRRFTTTLETVCSGEIRQSFEERGTLPTQEDYYERIYAKTASLFALATEIGPRLAGISNADIEAMRHFGKLMGLAFQIADYVLDLTGDEAQLGKPSGSDLRHGIVTLPVLLYLDQHPEARPHLESLLQRNEETAFEQSITRIQQSEAIDRASKIAASHIDEAIEILHRYPDSPYRQAMEEIAHFAVQRRY